MAWRTLTEDEHCMGGNYATSLIYQALLRDHARGNVRARHISDSTEQHGVMSERIASQWIRVLHRHWELGLCFAKQGVVSQWDDLRRCWVL